MTVHRFLQQTAERWPHREAVRWRGESWAYQDLCSRAEGVAASLVSAGVRPGDRVAIHAAKRPEVLAALYGVLLAGGVFVPLDPSAPAEYARSIAERCRIAALVLDAELAPAWVDWLERHPVRLVIRVAGEGDRTDPVAASFDEAAAATWRGMLEVTEEQPACVITTSGSTGTPKGVLHRHRALTEVATWTVAHVGVQADDRLAVHPPLHFVLSAYALFPAVLAAACTVLVPEEQSVLGWDLLRLIQTERISVWVSVPSALSLIRPDEADPVALGSLRAVVLSGEPVPLALIGGLRRAAPDAELWSLYGTTEAWGIAHMKVGPGDESAARSLGEAWEGVDVILIGPDGTLARLGEEGELYASSTKLMAGYWDDPEATRRVLVPDPSGRSPATFYRTGDVVRSLPNGGFELVGRRDQQITRRGYRIELGEIEAALEANPTVRAVGAVAAQDARRGTLITLYAVTESTAPPPQDLMAFLVERLPRHLLPDRIETVEELPRTSTGKVDRAALLDRSLSKGDPSARGGRSGER